MCLLALGQTSGQKADIRVDVALARIPFVAEDANGRPVRGLRREELSLTEDGAPRDVQHLWTELDLPLTTALVIDVSTSQMGLIRSHREAVKGFIGQVITPADRVLLATVDEQPRLVADFSSSPSGALDAVDSLARDHHAGQLFGEPCQPPPNLAKRGSHRCTGTAIWDGVFHLLKTEFAKGEGRKALVLISDGFDLGASVHGLSSSIEAAQSEGVVLYTIKYVSGAYFVLAPITAAQGRREHGMEEAPLQTGGLAFDQPKRLDLVFGQIEEDLRSQYVLAYVRADDPDPHRRRRIRVATSRPGVKIRVQSSPEIRSH
jgi:VWFA-related protein